VTQANSLRIGARHTQRKIAAKPLQIETWLLLSALNIYLSVYLYVCLPVYLSVISFVLPEW